MQRRRYQEMTHPDDLEAEEAALRQLLAGTRTSRTREARCVRKDGSTVWIRTTVALVRTPSGSPDYYIGSRLTVAVQNPGTIAPELLPDLFEPFRKAGQQAKSRGLGLGLYITKQIVEAHGGTIDVSTSADAGTRFRVVLPRESFATR
jgi:signal transduction histidine kinase